MELAFGSPARPALLLWIEVKAGSLPHEAQLLRYLADIRETGAALTQLVLLIPLGVATPALNPEARGLIRVERWERLGSWLQTWAKLNRRILDGAALWLLAEFAEFLKEQGLEQPSSLRSIDVVSLAHIDAAEKALTAVRDGADAILESQWGERTAHDEKGSRWFWRHYRPRGHDPESWHAGWRGGWFEWSVRIDTSLPLPRGELVMGAGYAVRKRDQPTGEKVDAWIAQMERLGYSVVVDDMWRLYRHAYPETLLARDSLEEQAQVLAAWVMDAFNVLMDHPIPRDADLASEASL